MTDDELNGRIFRHGRRRRQRINLGMTDDELNERIFRHGRRRRQRINLGMTDDELNGRIFRHGGRRRQRINLGMTDDELNDLEIADSKEEDKASLTYNKFNELLKKAQKLPDFAMEIGPNEKRRGRFVKSIEKLLAFYRETFTSCVSHCRKQKSPAL
ncbi:hypothetical protein AVEN_6390-1 [Araneus ventricosus]|uniref:Uncharacterized protein n=1 Tax=Araneus ventricosus TaxID=182803 RepID=A0A4Y2PL26_ARAVE|nr:hypothetical protein AVEN_39046-1 [Araneus ventricosus]GBN52743.1 hypothetical protein AVEN_37654-1 [Araneus ventricosus]GBN73226.1 hypothetical protein AVEN_112088-1 [Araneus ventricosus]GBN73273.1 hypothetical protein AVEN_6390-1 [Araneus ventricosus]